MMMISALVMTKTMASLENDDVIDPITDIIDKTENKVISLKKHHLVLFQSLTLSEHDPIEID